MSAGRWNASQKQDMVNLITAIHAKEGGNVPQYLVQVIFNELQSGNHFINKRPVPAQQIWVNGLIRAGRTEEQKDAIALRIMNECAAALAIDSSYVWVYVNDADKTAEFGKLLPKPGGEKEWLKSISQEVRSRYHMDDE